MRSDLAGWKVVFDIDDTLYLERDYVRSGFTAVGAYLGIGDFAAVAWQLFLDGGRHDTFNRTLEILGMPAGRIAVPDLVSVYRSHAPDIVLLPDAQLTLAAVTAGGAACAVITDGPEASQRAKADALRLADYSSELVFTAALGEGFGKPHPLGFERAMQGNRRDHHVYVADNPHKDFIAPRSLGWATVRIRRPGGLHHDAPSGNDVDFLIDSLATLPAILLEDIL